jgi:hypothetical protein
MNTPFLYPPAPHARRHGPQRYADCASYLPWLRDEFCFRWVYCLLREQWGRLRGVYAIDPFLPVAHHPARVTDYDNLLYTCATCKAARGARAVPNPLVVLTSPAVRVAEDGTVHADSVEAAQRIELLGLDSPPSTEFRMLWIGIVSLAARYAPELHSRLMSFPDDLPDLRRLQPPGGNSRPQGVGHSALCGGCAANCPAPTDRADDLLRELLEPRRAVELADHPAVETGR